MDQRTINNLSLCSGGGGLDLGLELVIPTLRTVCWVEWEAFAINHLVEAMEAGCLAQAPVWTDLRTFDGKPWRRVVDSLTAGFPCQPWSLSGKRRGQDDPRHLWPHVARVIGEVEPSIVFLENVPGLLSTGGGTGFLEVTTQLKELGYEVAAGLFTAAEIGASHKRERLFILANCGCQRRQQERRSPLSNEETDGRTRRDKQQPDSDNLVECQGERGLKKTLGDSFNGGLQGRCLLECGRTDQCVTGPPIGTSLFPPGPDEVEQWLEVPKYLWPAIEPGVCSVVDGLARTDWLRLLGNGVVPLQAAYAFISLWASLRCE